MSTTPSPMLVGQEIVFHSNPEGDADAAAPLPSDFNAVAADPTIVRLTNILPGTAPGDCDIFALAVGSTTITITGTNADGTVISSDPITVTVEAPGPPPATLLTHWAPTFEPPTGP